MERVSETNKLVVASMEEKIEAKDKEIGELKFLLSKSLRETQSEKRLRDELLVKVKGMCAVHARLAGEFASEVQKEAEMIRMYSLEKEIKKPMLEPGAKEETIEKVKQLVEENSEEALNEVVNEVEETAQEAFEQGTIEKQDTLAEIETTVEKIVNTYAESEVVDQNDDKEAMKNDSEQLYDVVQREMLSPSREDAPGAEQDAKDHEDVTNKEDEEIEEIVTNNIVDVKEKQECAKMPTVIRDFSGNKILGMDDHELSECFNNIMKEENC